jgi:uncharacterized LabA/DUF88 family protein
MGVNMAHRGKTIVYFVNSNIFHGQLDAGWRIVAERLQSHLSKDGNIWQVYFFAAVSEPPRFGQTNFYRILKERLRWETIILPLGSRTTRCKKCGSNWRTATEKGIDVAIANRMLTHAITKAFDTAILVSGDKDYLEAVRTVKNMGLRVEVVSFRRSLSQELSNESSAPVLLLDDIRSEIELYTPDREAEQLILGEQQP